MKDTETTIESAEMLKEKRTDLTTCDVRQIVIKDGFNVREDYGDIGELAASIKENGIMQPLRGYRDGDSIVIIDGHRRHKALMLLFAEGTAMHVPIKVVKKPTDFEMVVQMFTMNEGKHLTSMEQSEAVNRLAKYGYSDKEIATMLGKTQATICNLRLLASLPKKMKTLVTSGKVSSSLVMDMVRNMSDGQTVETLTDELETLVELKKETATPTESGKVSKKDGKITKKDLKGAIEQKGKVKFDTMKELQTYFNAGYPEQPENYVWNVLWKLAMGKLDADGIFEVIDNITETNII